MRHFNITWFQWDTSFVLDECLNCLSWFFTMMTSSDKNIFRVTGHLCGEFVGHRWIPTQRPVRRSFDVFFDLRLNERLSKQWWGWWFETPSRPLWLHWNDAPLCSPRPHTQEYWYVLHTDHYLYFGYICTLRLWIVPCLKMKQIIQHIKQISSTNLNFACSRCGGG